MKTENKGGRPVKVAGQKKAYFIGVKMDTQEYYTLKAKAREAGISISECVRQSVLGSVIRQRLTPEMHDLIRKLCGMANNLNQIARKANAQGYRNAQLENLQLARCIRKLVTHLRHDD
ncbi:MAG: plasmid mobilization relaxosome protein MobC [Bacteroidota bacterium]|nr:plasmid mobilization relaxosome protein MobC [Bacteroidota bacterium]